MNEIAGKIEFFLTEICSYTRSIRKSIYSMCNLARLECYRASHLHTRNELLYTV